MTTLAEMTPEQRDEAVGLWCTLQWHGEEKTGIVREVKHFGAAITTPDGTVFKPALKQVTPRPDLPRAWTPQGQPVPGCWEGDITDAAGTLVVDGTITDITAHGHTPVRRFVTEWEEMP